MTDECVAVASRNQREGRYGGRKEGRHVRSHYLPTGVYEGEKLLFSVPVPSGASVLGVVLRRYPRAAIARARERGRAYLAQAIPVAHLADQQGAR